MATACVHMEIGRNTGSPDGGGVSANWHSVRSRPGRYGVAERPVVPVNPGNAGGGKGPQFKVNVKAARAGRVT